MPVYEFSCKQCGHRFEQLCRLDWQGSARCPNCQSTELNKEVSRIQRTCGGGESGGTGCAGCSGKSCATCH